VSDNILKISEVEGAHGKFQKWDSWALFLCAKQRTRCQLYSKIPKVRTVPFFPWDPFHPSQCHQEVDINVSPWLSAFCRVYLANGELGWKSRGKEEIEINICSHGSSLQSKAPLPAVMDPSHPAFCISMLW
jgi:hypothetical protein